MAESSKEGYSYSNPGRLYWHRFRTHWRELAAVLRSVADWIVYLYIIIPGILLGARLYYGLWKEPLPEWSTQLPYGVVPLFIAFVMSTGNILLMVHEGDILFIQQHKHWLQGLMLRGSIYSMIVTALKVCAGFMLVLPFLVRQFDASLVTAGCWLLFSVMGGVTLVWLRHFVRVQRTGWRRQLYYLPLLWLPAAGYIILSILWRNNSAAFVGSAVVLALLSLGLLFKRIRMRGTFMNDVQEELVQHTKLTGLVLSQAVDKPRRVRSASHKPWILRHSQGVFRSRSPKHRLAGAVIKALLRRPKQLTLYLRFTSVCIAVLLTLPAGVQIIIYLAIHMLLAYWLYLNGFSFMKESFVSFLPWAEDVKFQAVALAVRAMLLPFAIIASGILLFSLFPVWIAVIALIPLAVGMSRFTVYMLHFMMMRKI